jgi:prepilin-type N-terminal cleavage/methylation domain-containing protein
MKGFTLVELLTVIIISLVAMAIVIVPLTKCFVTIPIVYSDGERTGQVVKFSKKGVFFKTWEGEMVLGGLTDSIANVWKFSVRDPEVVKQIRDASVSGNRITLVYNEYFLVSYRDGETDYIVTQVLK